MYLFSVKVSYRPWGYRSKEDKVPTLIVIVYSLSYVSLFATLWTIAHQAPLSMGFHRQEYWSELLFPSPRDLLDPAIELASPALAGGFFPTEPIWEAPHPHSAFVQVRDTDYKYCKWEQQ